MRTFTILSMAAFLGAGALGAAAGSPESDAAPPAGLEALAFLAGEWDARFETFADTWGEEAAGTTHGYVSARYGPHGAWFELESGMDLPGSGAYAVKVVVYEDGRSGSLRAYVVNSFRSGVAYEGGVTDDGRIVFETPIGDRVQRVVYENHGDRVRFAVDESYDDGATFLRHTESWWTARSASPGDGG